MSATDDDQSGPGSVFAEAQLLHRSGRLQAAESAYREILQADASHGAALHGLGSLLYQQQRFAEAVNVLERAVASAPRSALSLGLLSAAQAAAGATELALQTAERAVALRPDDAGLRDLAGQLAADCGHPARAVSHLRVAAEKAPGQPQVMHNLAIALHKVGEFEQAIAAYNQTLKSEPSNAQLYYNLGMALQASGRPDAARNALQQCLELQPDHVEALYRLAYLHKLLCDWHACDALLPQLRQALITHVASQGAASIWPYALNTLGLDELHDDCARYFSRQVEQRAQRLRAPFVHTSDSADILNIGYLSADFRAHAVGGLFHQLPAAHDRNRVRVHAYSLFASADEYQQQVRDEVDVYRDLTPIGSREAAEMIAADQLHVLFDLTGYTEHARPEIMALRPAPLQVSWLGYLNTMQASFIDYVVADKSVMTPALEARHSEAVIELPGCFFPGSRLPATVIPARADVGLDPDAFVFCSFNHSYKIDPALFDCWMTILQQTEHSQLWLYAGGIEQVETTLRARVRESGVAEGRVVFAPRLPVAAHQARLACADLFLDTVDYNAGATAMAVAQAGVPILTVTGERWLNRMSTSINRVLGVDELCVPDLQAYQRKAIALSRRDQQYQAVLQQVSQPDALFDVAQHAAQIEEACRRIWDHYRGGGKPQRIEIAGHG
ncbi:MAG: tetratricopeptide repeat protein [Gammaproteobacteria bacterium]|nr:tetratricopeptide repeat protein [Gammaproteobacteria bacterium]